LPYSASKKIKIHGELARLADATGEDRLLRIWYGLRLLDDGRGWLPDTPYTRKTLVRLGVAPSQQSLRKLLRQGNDVWWRLDCRHGRYPRTIAITGLKAVSIHVARNAQQMGIPDAGRCPGRAVWVRARYLGGGLSQWRAALLQVWIAGRKDNQLRIDWATMERRWGRSRTTLRARCQAAGTRIVVTHNYVALHLSAFSLEPNPVYDQRALPSAEGATLTTLNGERCLLWQRPNTYAARGYQARKGMSRKVHQAVCHALAIPPRAYGRRQYFFDHKTLGKVRKRHPDREVYLWVKRRKWGQFWEMWPAMN
jgi:hypothetical protein